MASFPTWLRIALLSLLNLTVCAQTKPMTDYRTDWRKADSLMAKGLPKSALEIADRVYTDAKKTSNEPQLLKAAMRRVVFRTQAAKDEDTYLTLVHELTADVAANRGATRAVLQSVLAEVYWQYYQANRYRFTNRTATSAPADVSGPDSTDRTDPRAWDTRRLVRTVTELYLASVSEGVALQKTPLAAYDAVLMPGNAEGRILRPTLYDVLAQRAIAFFSNTEADFPRPVNAFDLNDPTYLADAETFARKALPATDTESGKYQATRLYQQLIQFHLADKDPLALAVLDVERLRFVQNGSTLPNERELIEKTLRQAITRYKAQPERGTGAEAEYTLMLVRLLAEADRNVRPLYGRGSNQGSALPADTTRRQDRRRAADLARDLIARFPDTYPAQDARSLLDNLLRPVLSVQTEAVNVPNQPFRARVEFQNVKTLFYRILRFTPDELLRLDEHDYQADPKRDQWFADLQGHKVVAQGQLALPDDGDLHSHSTEIPLDGLPLGHYVLIVSNEGRFAKPSEERAEIVQISKVVISNLAYIAPNQYRSDKNTFYLADRTTGAATSNVKATVLIANERTSTRRTGYTAGATKTADKTGKLVFDNSQVPFQRQYLIRFTDGADILDAGPYYRYDQRYPRPDESQNDRHAVLFTDRAIYRPGQTIYVKALLYRGKDNDFAVMPNESFTVSLHDVNDKEVAEVKLKTNEFGTATGTITAPVGRLTGEMALLISEGTLNTRTSIRVEEYKRPTFAVVAEPMKQAPTLGQTVTIKATAKTLAGAVVDGASVRYRVVRQYVQPYWYWWRSFRPSVGGEQEIANDTARTAADGTVSFTFVAQPDASLAATEKPRFTYTVTIDVTDRSGETRSTTQTLNIGYTALTASLNVPNPVLTTDKKTYPVKLTNASNVPVTLRSGTVALARLTPLRNGALLRSRPWEQPDRPLLTRAEFEKRFPLDLYADEDNPATWTKTPVRTEPANAVSLAGLTPGLYEAQIDATDSTGKTARETIFLTVVDPQQPSAPIRSGELVQVQKGIAQPGEEAVFWVGTRQPGRVLMAIEEKGKIVREEWITTTNVPVRVALPVSEKHRGGFAVHFAMIQNGRFLSETEAVAVPFSNKQLTIETETFRNKLQPGQDEQWTLRVSGPNQGKVLAELVATLYDASLDEFVKHDWQTNFYQTYGSSGTYWEGGRFGTETARQYWYGQSGTVLVTKPRVYPELSWGPYVYDTYSSRFILNRVIPQTANIWIQRDGDVLTGRVLLEQDHGLPGVTVRLKATKRTATTKADGSFRLELPGKSYKNPTLLFSIIGFVSEEVALGDRRLVSATMQQDATMLTEQIAVGYGGGVGRRDATRAANFKRGRGNYSGEQQMAMAAAPAMDQASGGRAEVLVAEESSADAFGKVAEGGQSKGRSTNSPAPVIRKNFNETAFFFPQLQTDAQGRMVLKFTMPEALTTWRLLTFAHTKTMQTGSFEATAQTQKELMVTTNVPRFFRENDTLRLTARIDNLSPKALTGTAQLTLMDALTGEPLSAKMSLRASDVAFTAKAGQGTVATWTLVVPQGLPPVAVRVTARAGNFTDGEERVVPVLPNRILVTDVKPFWIDGGDKTKTFTLTELAKRNPELPMQTERYTVEVTSNPAWYALQSLPYLMEYQYDCAEQLFSKLYANALGAHILNSRPAFRQVVDGWKQNPPKSPLAKNEELKAVVLENTPWLAEATSETERTAKLGQFFDQNSLANQQRLTIAKLRNLQQDNGGLMWFSGFRPNFFVTLHVLGGLGHLQKLGVKFDADVTVDVSALQTNMLRYVDNEARRMMAEEKARSKNNVSTNSYWAATYLYARSFYVANNPVANDLLTYLLPSLQKNWQQSNLQGQALAAVTLHRFGQKTDALGILNSLTERSKLSDELGLYWPDNVAGTFWYQAPVETQAYLIEAYLEAGATGGTSADPFTWYRKQPALAKTTGNTVFIDKMRQWLVQQKRTQAWPSTKATTEAVYALLLTGSDWLDTKSTVTVRVGGQDIAKRATTTESLTGYQKVTFAPAEVTPQMGVIEVSKSAKTGISWGAAYWQHFEPLDAVAKSQKGNLNLKKTLFRQRNTDTGPVLEPITPQTPLKPGDLLTVRVVLTTDRIMEYVHLKDGRAAGFEPVAVLSGTKYQNGLLYYEAPRDASTDFFIEYLPAGTHVFEYNLRVVHGGDFGTGIAQVQCFYAPEFATHSAGGRVTVN